jgi:hypothetical protein
MNKAILGSLSEDDTVLVMQTERARLADLDEDALVELHTRVRRARNKYVKLYRRQASARVAEKGGRGKARPANRRSATALRDERIAAAQSVRSGSKAPKAGPPHRAGSRGRATADRRVSTPAAKKRVSTSAAAGARRQAKKDKR